MKFKKIVALWVMFIVSANLFAGKSLYRYQNKETRNLVKLVENAVQLINFYGETSFDELRRSNGRWATDGISIFVYDMAGTSIVNPAFPKLEGKNFMDMQDSWGKYFVKDYIREVYQYGKNKENGWFHYLWPRSSDGKITWRTTFVARAKSPKTGTEYVVGAGMNDMKMEKAFMVDAVNDAVDLIRNKGLKKAIEVITSKDEEFYFNDTYVFVATEKAEILANDVFASINPNIDKKTNFWQIQDMERKFVFREFVELAKSDNKDGWFVSVWQSKNSNSNVPVYMHTYVRGLTIDNMLYIIGVSSELEL